MIFYTEDLLLLRYVFKNNRFDIYDLHLLYHLSPAQVSRTIQKFESLGVIELSDSSIVTLTEEGVRWLISNRKMLFMKKKDRIWRQYGREINVDSQFYLPKRNEIDPEIFKLKLGE